MKILPMILLMILCMALAGCTQPKEPACTEIISGGGPCVTSCSEYGPGWTENVSRPGFCEHEIPTKAPISIPTEIQILSRNLIRTTVCNSSLCSNITRMASGELVSSTCPETCQPITDRFDLPGNGTYHIIVKTYQPETDVVVQVEYQEFQSQDKFGNKAYYPNNSQSLGESDRFSDFETTRFLPPPGKYCAEKEYSYHKYGKNIPSACTSADTRNLTLVLVTTKAHQGRITVELWKVA